MLVIGLMSGTSLDGVDASLVEITKNDNDFSYKELDANFLPYPSELKMRILEVSNIKTSNVQKICSLNVELGYIYLDAVKEILKKNNLNSNEITFVAMHGQTIWHNPNHMDGLYSSTLQIGDPSIIAYNLNVEVISNFRPMDMAAGGTGAPLVPFVNFVLYKNKEKNVAFQNIGGIGNVTYIKKNANCDEVIAFDTGPGNMLIDLAMMKLYNKPFDEGGNVALSGVVNKEVLTKLLDDEYYNLPYPKSTGREKYNENYLTMILNMMKESKKEDIIATITALTSDTIVLAYQKFCQDVDKIVLSGGGSYNQFIVNRIKELTKKEVTIHNMNDSYEAFCFAILGHYTYLHLPSNLKVVTGAKEPVILGQVTYPPRKKD